ncbi:MAG: acylphosphatase [Candidatus Marinimicrobia bacterium]|nr:acylphosphatase [Candidatus Neomarinimicrobiota bacterium]
MNIITNKLTVSGTVQMVGYRWYAKQKADQMNIKGFVRNISRGEVEIIAQGNEDDILTYIDHLKQGPSRAQVARIVYEPVIEEKIFQQFSIKM